MEQDELLRVTASVFERLDIDYFVTGSMATIAFGISRYTNDIDIVAEISNDHVAPLCDAFPPPDFYCSANAIREAIARRRQFNILHLTSGLKVDVIVPARTDFNHARMSRKVKLKPAADLEVWFSTPEDAIIKKLDFYREGQSEKHLTDIANVLKIQGSNIDVPYIESWIQKLNLQAEWRLVKDQLDSQRKS